MSTKHTPAPWTFFAKYEGELITGIQTNNGIIADILGSNHCEISKKEAVANAKLIAAAPELLGALQNVLLADKNGEGLEDAIDKAYIVIRKATGE